MVDFATCCTRCRTRRHAGARVERANPALSRVIEATVALDVATPFALLVVAFELIAGLLILWHGRPAQFALLAAGLWGLAMLPVIPPYGLPIGIALTGAPGVAGLSLARCAYPESVIELIGRALRHAPRVRQAA